MCVGGGGGEESEEPQGAGVRVGGRRQASQRGTRARGQEKGREKKDVSLTHFVVTYIHVHEHVHVHAYIQLHVHLYMCQKSECVCVCVQ